jgi:N-methylhydantoinase A/oxoprolinase/acetone carboxylase beta subunit
MTSLTLGIDIGGTFTDLVAISDRQQIYTAKVLTTPADPADGVRQGLAELLERHELVASNIRHVIHATTLITNAIIERKGATIGFVTTAGFRDLLEIGREVRYDLYDLFLHMPEPLAPGPRRMEVRERIAADGDVLLPLEEADVLGAVEELLAQGVEAVAVGFLHAYANDRHERQAAAIIAQAHPDLPVSISSEVAREIREYERFSTTAANAYVQPLARRYFRRLERDLESAGTGGPLHVMLSNGGYATPDVAGDLPVRLIESGPAAGALIAGHYGKATGQASVLAFDMGGTTAKLSLIEDGVPAVIHGLEVARVHRFKRGSGLPIKAPSVELIEIGAGGGSIAHIDQLGLLAVGPESAGSDPGPACYGFGGTRPAVTDADLVLGYLNPDYFLGGQMSLDVDAARRAIDRNLASPLGLDVEQVAWGIHDMVNENMATAAGVYIAEQGKDPRRFTLIATGGAGPVHAAEVARKIGLSTVIVPPSAGVASAAGLLVASPRMDFAHSLPARLADVDWPAVNGILADLEASGRRALRDAGVQQHEMTVERVVDLRYVNQGHEVSISLPGGTLGPGSVDEIVAGFDREYTARFNRTIPGVPVEAITWRLTVLGPTPDLEFAAPRPVADAGRGTTVDGASKCERLAYFPDGGYRPVPVYDRYRLQSRTAQSGPAILEEDESTTIVGPGDRFEVDGALNVIVRLSSAGGSESEAIP